MFLHVEDYNKRIAK